MLHSPVCISKKLKTLTDRVKHSEKLSKLISQCETVDIMDHCFLNISNLFSVEKHSLRKRNVPFPDNFTKKKKFSGNLEQILPSYFPTDSVNDDVEHLVKTVKQTIDEKTKNWQVENEQKVFLV